MLEKLLALLVLKAAPQDLPYSQRLTLQLAVAYIFSGIIVLQTTMKPTEMLGGLIFSLFVQFVFIYLVLQALHRSERFLQTICAVVGVGILFNIISWPILLALTNEASNESLGPSMSLLFLLLISWEVLVKAHIFRHAFEMKLFAAMALSISLFFISVALSQLIFPAEIS